jgi:hypothetical protein
LTFSSTKSTFESVFQWLNGTDETQWQDQIGLLRQTIPEFKRMSAPLKSEDKGGSRNAQMPIHDPDFQKMKEAIPHLERMLYEMRGHKRMEAIEHGTEALRVLNNGIANG